MKKKILILDGVSGISLGREIDEAFRDLNVSTRYVASDRLVRKPFYKPIAEIKKAIHRQMLNEEYYHNPKISNTRFRDLIDEHQADIVFVIGFLYRFFDLDFVRQLKALRGFELYLYDTDSCNLFNNKRELVFFYDHELPLYDRIYSFSRTTTSFIDKNKNLNCEYFPFGAKPIDPERLNSPISGEQIDILFVGSADMRRIFMLEQLAGFDLHVFGSKWARNQSVISTELNNKIRDESIWGADLHRELLRSKIVLNITRSSFYGVETGVNLRIFEALAAHRFLLTDHTPELEDLFRIGEEIESYSSSEELVDKVQFYLENEEKRNKIARKGHDAYLQSYTWNSRIKELLGAFSRNI